jgi:hypothetical protein
VFIYNLLTTKEIYFVRKDEAKRSAAASRDSPKWGYPSNARKILVAAAFEFI